MNTMTVPTRRGLFAFLARKFELLNVNATLHYAERDRAYLLQQIEDLPRELAQKDLDIGALRCRQVYLRNL